MLYKVFLTVVSIDEILESVTIQMKATEQYFPVVLFIMLTHAVLGGSTLGVNGILVTIISVELTEQLFLVVMFAEQ